MFASDLKKNSHLELELEGREVPPDLLPHHTVSTAFAPDFAYGLLIASKATLVSVVDHTSALAYVPKR